jgi:hypothetical protein
VHRSARDSKKPSTATLKQGNRDCLTIRILTGSAAFVSGLPTRHHASYSPSSARRNAISAAFSLLSS